MMSQVNGNFITKDKNMAIYLKKVMDLLLFFKKFKLIEISWTKNIHADALVKLASGKDLELLKVFSIEHLARSSIS